MLIKQNFEVKNLTSFKVGGCIQKVLFPENIDEFINCLRENPEAVVCGNLTNTLVSSDGFDGTLILTANMTDFKITGLKVIAECGVIGAKLSQKVAEKGLHGLEFMVAFPGSVGGEVFMNAGAHGQSISDTFVKGKFYDRKKDEIVTLTKNEMGFSYRTSVCQQYDLIVLNAEFELSELPVDEIKLKMKENLDFRHTHQPSLALPNCGSVFRNPEGNSAGQLLDLAGAKNFKGNGVQVWENHANFIINNGGTSTDILELMLKMRDAVHKNFDIELKPEVRYFGNRNKREEDICKILYQNFKNM